jgi:acetylornithine deacetylase/succinyl-diaminopimelate desuccinylase-like protein
MPGIADNALVKAATLIERIAAYQPEPQIQPEVEAFLRTVLGEVPSADKAVARAAALHQTAAELIEPLLTPTFSPTMISASLKRNVIPALCTIVVDCRLLPGQMPQDIEPVLQEILGSDIAYDLNFQKAEGGTRSTLDTPLWSTVESFISELEPGAAPVPVICAGFTDSHWLREAFGTVAYGFFPYRTMAPELAATLIHSADERVPASDLELGVDWLRHAARTVGA